MLLHYRRSDHTAKALAVTAGRPTAPRPRNARKVRNPRLSLTILGEEEEVVGAAAEHAASVHGHEDTPEFREQLRGMLEPADSYDPGAREQEPLPG